ncbi:MAG: hypothetical protein IJW24_04815, partial [Clostridia bacterium]|nr:hypothetical protein [Clostridia bacterium]
DAISEEVKPGAPYKQELADRIMRRTSSESISLWTHIDWWMDNYKKGRIVYELGNTFGGPEHKAQEREHFQNIIRKIRKIYQHQVLPSLKPEEVDKSFEENLERAELLTEKLSKFQGNLTPEDVQACRDAVAKVFERVQQGGFSMCVKNAGFKYEQLQNEVAVALQNNPKFMDAIIHDHQVSAEDLLEVGGLVVETLNKFFEHKGLAACFDLECEQVDYIGSSEGSRTFAQASYDKIDGVGNTKITMSKAEFARVAGSMSGREAMMKVVDTSSHEYGHAIDNFLNAQERKAFKRDPKVPEMTGGRILLLASISQSVFDKWAKVMDEVDEAKAKHPEQSFRDPADILAGRYEYLQYYDQECEQNARNFSGYILQGVVQRLTKRNPEIADALASFSDERIEEIVSLGDCGAHEESVRERDEMLDGMRSDLSRIQDLTDFNEMLGESCFSEEDKHFVVKLYFEHLGTEQKIEFARKVLNEGSFNILEQLGKKQKQVILGIEHSMAGLIESIPDDELISQMKATIEKRGLCQEKG